MNSAAAEHMTDSAGSGSFVIRYDTVRIHKVRYRRSGATAQLILNKTVVNSDELMGTLTEKAAARLAFN